MEGKAGHHIRLVCAYRPCASGGAGAVFQQRARSMATQDDFRNPRTAMLEDLVHELVKWKGLGDHILLGMDANKDVRCGEVHAVFQAAGLSELILDLHSDQSPPATYNRNTQRQPIDSMWGKFDNLKEQVILACALKNFQNEVRALLCQVAAPSQI
jgi:hypothetical protein